MNIDFEFISASYMEISSYKLKYTVENLPFLCVFFFFKRKKLMKFVQDTIFFPIFNLFFGGQNTYIVINCS